MLKWGLKMIEPFQDRLNNIPLVKRTFQKVYDKFAPDEWMLVDVEGVKRYINPHDRAISRFIIQQGAYERGTTRVFKNVVKPGMTVIDIGAHWGYYSLIAAILVGKKGEVFSFEPHPFSYESLLKTITQNGFNTIIPIKKAVLDSNGMAELFCSDLNAGGHSMVLSEGEGSHIDVKTIALDDFCEVNQIIPDIVKMDVEGAEPLALKGMKRTIERSKDLKMFIEFEHNKEELFDFLSQYFSVYCIKNDGHSIRFEEACHQSLEPNIYCVRR